MDPLSVLLSLLAVEMLVIGALKLADQVKVAKAKREYRQYVRQMRSQAEVNAARIEACASNWAEGANRIDKAEMLYCHVDGNRQRFLELAESIPLTKAGAATYYSLITHRRHRGSFQLY